MVSFAIRAGEGAEEKVMCPHKFNKNGAECLDKGREKEPKKGKTCPRLN